MIQAPSHRKDRRDGFERRCMIMRCLDSSCTCGVLICIGYPVSRRESCEILYLMSPLIFSVYVHRLRMRISPINCACTDISFKLGDMPNLDI